MTTTWWRRLIPYARPYRRSLGGVLLLMLSSVIFSVLAPWPLKLVVDYVLTGEPLPEGWDVLVVLPGTATPAGLLAWLAGATVLLFLAARGTETGRAVLSSRLGGKMTYDLGGDLFDRLQRLSLRFHGTHRVGDLVRRVTTDVSCVRGLVVGVFLQLATSLATLVVMFGIMWRLDPVLSLIALVAAPPLGMVIKLFAGPMAERTYEQQEREGELMARAEQTLTAVPVVQAFGREPHEDRQFRSMTHRTLRAYLRALASQMGFKIGTNTVTALGTAGLMIVGGLHVLNGTLTVGSLLVFLSYLASLYAPMETMAYLSTSVASAKAGARRVLEVLEAEEGVREAPDARPLPPPTRGAIAFEHVTFAYEPGTPVLQDVCLSIEPGETVALVGPTGAGKTTLASLIPRFFDPDRGTVRFDGHDVRHLTLESLRRQVALVLQEPFLLPLSVAENIAYGRPGASREEIERAAQAAQAAGFIASLPEGYDTVLGERGARLSGGQRQRLAIARALLKDAPVVLLDEPTSALDAGTEAGLMEALERLVAGRTVVVIAHRMTTVQRADRVVLLEHGRIARVWSQAEVAGADALYHGLHEMQFDLTAKMPAGRW